MDAEAQPDLDRPAHMAARFMLQTHVSLISSGTDGQKYSSLTFTLTVCMSDLEVQYDITVTVFTNAFYKFVIINLTKVKSHK